MKDATGELSMTAIAVVAIAAVAAIFTVFILPRLRTSINIQTKCQSAFGCTDCDGTVCTCQVFSDDDGTTETIQCPDPSANTNN